MTIRPRFDLAVVMLAVGLYGCRGTEPPPPLPLDPDGSAVVRIESGLSDTLHQRSASLLLSVLGVDGASVTVDAAVDSGTAAERTATVINRCSKALYLGAPDCAADSTGWLIEFADTLSNGPHRLLIHVSGVGQGRSLTSNFVIDVAPVRYTLTALPGLGGTDSDALDVNDAGEVAGWANDAAGASQGATWQQGAITMLPTSATARSSKALALNEGGVVVGSVVDTAGTVVCERGIRWSGGSWTYALAPTQPSAGTPPPTPGYCDQRVVDVNVTGTMLIRRQFPRPPFDTQTWIDRGGVQTTIPNVYAYAVNDRDEVVGDRYDLDITPHFYSSTGTVVAPGVRFPDNAGHQAGELVSINNRSQMLGTFAGTLFFAPIAGGQPIDLNPALAFVASGTGTGAYAPSAVLVRLTDDGTVLAFDPRIGAPFLWRQGGTTRVAVTTPGWRIDRVAGINSAGDIVGHATELATGRTTAVLLRRAP